MHHTDERSPRDLRLAEGLAKGPLTADELAALLAPRR